MPEKLKDNYFTKESVTKFADVLKSTYSKFDKKKFVKSVFDKNYGNLELMAKMHHVTECMKPALPVSYKKTLGILIKAAPKVKGFESICLPDFVERYGVENWEISLDALAVFTKYSSSEFAIRPFIIMNEKKAMAYMKKLAKDKEKNVRRFSSEGCRPRLPWAMALPNLKKDPSSILPILELLKNDESEFVRRSVANNLNDISKDHPNLALKISKQWFGKTEDTNWIVKHACRTLLKAGNSQAMKLFGFGDPKNISVNNLKVNKKKIKIGEKTEFSYTLKVGSKKKTKIRLEYAVTFAKANNKFSKKVFKISEKEYKPGEYNLSKKHSFANLSTRKHYVGKHAIAIIVNGVEKANIEFLLTK
ncbi:MAG: DNA alkylation repair protein [candidate division Zixibacteria bacterium]|nr:DNA alkylation repair protein [candidate division Zixibacteria bacterium]